MAKRARWKLIVGWLLPAVLTVGVIVAYEPDQQPGDVVRAYLDAVRTGDVDTAMTYVRDSGQLDENVPLLTDTAGGDWEIIKVVQDVDSDDYARVQVLLGVDGRAVRPDEDDGEPQWFSLHRTSDGAWRIDEPLAWFGTVDSPFLFVDVGGARKATPPATEDRLYLIFPGVHPVYQHTADLVKVSPGRIVATPGSKPQAPDDVVLTERGKAAANSAMRTYLDTCAVEAAAPDGCPFGVEEQVRVDVDTTLRDVTNVTYQMTEYPQVESETIGWVFEPDIGSAAVVRVSGTGTDRTGAPQPFTIDCGFTIWTGVTVDVNGRMSVDGDYPDGGKRGMCGQV